VIVAGLVLGAVLLPILGIIDTAAQLDAAMAIQRSIRIAELQRRMTGRNYWSYALLALAFVLQIAALAVDHLAHPSRVATSIRATSA
jgi:hypothetical protein